MIRPQWQWFRTAAVLAAVALAPAADARDERMLFDVDPVLASPLGKDRFDETVQFYFGERPYPQVLEAFGIHTSERRTFAPIHTDGRPAARPSSRPSPACATPPRPAAPTPSSTSRASTRTANSAATPSSSAARATSRRVSRSKAAWSSCRAPE
jgi:hypothetical protein